MVTLNEFEPSRWYCLNCYYYGRNRLPTDKLFLGSFSLQLSLSEYDLCYYPLSPSASTLWTLGVMYWHSAHLATSSIHLASMAVFVRTVVIASRCSFFRFVSFPPLPFRSENPYHRGFFRFFPAVRTQ